MIKLLVFEADGTLFKTSQISWQALNKALESFDQKYSVSEAEYLTHIYGKSIKDEVSQIGSLKSVPSSLFDKIEKLRNKYAFEGLVSTKGKNLLDDEAIQKLQRLKTQYPIYLISNESEEFISLLLYLTKTNKCFTRIFTRSSIRHGNPSPEVYLRCFLKAEVCPSECTVINNIKYGIEAAKSACANVISLQEPGSIKDLII